MNLKDLVNKRSKNLKDYDSLETIEQNNISLYNDIISSIGKELIGLDKKTDTIKGLTQEIKFSSFNSNLDDVSEGSTNKHFTEANQTKLTGIDEGANVTADNLGMPISVGIEPPINPKDGWLWLDTSVVPNKLKRFSGNSEASDDCIDADGNEYATIEIGDQTWMAENLKTTKYNNDSNIANITDDTLWNNDTDGAYCAYNNDSDNESDTYGYLYNWYAINNSKNLAPEGWHVPFDSEIKQLEQYLGLSEAKYAVVQNG